MEDIKMHQTRGLKRRGKKSNNTVMFKKNDVFRSIGGSTFGPNKNSVDIEVKTSALSVPKTILITGEIAQSGTNPEDVVLNGEGAPSLFDQLYVSLNGQDLVRIPQNAGHVATLNNSLYNSVEEDKFAKVLALKGKTLTAGTKYPFQIKLSTFGLDLEEFIPTSQSAIQVRIVLAPVEKVFHGVDSGAGQATSYELTDVKLTGDFYRLTQSATDLVQKTLNGAQGASYVSQVYVQNTSNLNAGQDQNLLIPMLYRNIVSTFFLPIDLTIGVEANSRIPTTDPIGLLSYKAPVSNNIATDLRVNFVGGEYMNQNGNEAEKTKSEHFQALLKCARYSSDSKSYASVLADKYVASEPGTYQIMGTSFLKDEENDVHIVDNGTNGYNSNGNLNVQFRLETNPSTKQLLTIAKITSQLRIQNGAVSITM